MTYEGTYELEMDVFGRKIWMPLTISLRGVNHNVTMYYLDFGGDTLNCSKEDRILQTWFDRGQLIKREPITPLRKYIRHKI